MMHLQQSLWNQSGAAHSDRLTKQPAGLESNHSLASPSRAHSSALHKKYISTLFLGSGIRFKESKACSWSQHVPIRGDRFSSFRSKWGSSVHLNSALNLLSQHMWVSFKVSHKTTLQCLFFKLLFVCFLVHALLHQTNANSTSAWYEVKSGTVKWLHSESEEQKTFQNH